MACILPNSTFYHIPKTGGTWVKTAMRRSGLAYFETDNTHYPPRAFNGQVTNRFSFLFVRHPLWWYRSYWCFRMAIGWEKYSQNPTWKELHIDWYAMTFEEFCNNVIEKTPGWYSSMLELYIDNNNIDFIGKTENLTDDLVIALTKAGERFDEQTLRETPMVNCSPLNPQYTEEHKKKIQELDARTISRFGYSLVD